MQNNSLIRVFGNLICSCKYLPTLFYISLAVMLKTKLKTMQQTISEAVQIISKSEIKKFAAYLDSIGNNPVFMALLLITMLKQKSLIKDLI